jgi:hypothetical protein
LSDWTESRKADEGPDFERVDAALTMHTDELMVFGYVAAVTTSSILFVKARYPKHSGFRVMVA